MLYHDRTLTVTNSTHMGRGKFCDEMKSQITHTVYNYTNIIRDLIPKGENEVQTSSANWPPRQQRTPPTNRKAIPKYIH